VHAPGRPGELNLTLPLAKTAVRKKVAPNTVATRKPATKKVVATEKVVATRKPATKKVVATEKVVATRKPAPKKAATAKKAATPKKAATAKSKQARGGQSSPR
jgi:ribonuclease R